MARELGTSPEGSRALAPARATRAWLVAAVIAAILAIGLVLAYTGSSHIASTTTSRTTPDIELDDPVTINPVTGSTGFHPVLRVVAEEQPAAPATATTNRTPLPRPSRGSSGGSGTTRGGGGSRPATGGTGGSTGSTGTSGNQGNGNGGLGNGQGTTGNGNGNGAGNGNGNGGSGNGNGNGGTDLIATPIPVVNIPPVVVAAAEMPVLDVHTTAGPFEVQLTGATLPNGSYSVTLG